MGVGRCRPPQGVDRAGLKVQDIGLVELNEAFAVRSLAVIEVWLDLKSSHQRWGDRDQAPLGCSGSG
jgi:acetyl-CoA acetyltransferase